MIKYTKQEEKALAAIEEKYRPELEAAMAEMNKYDVSKQREEWIAAANRFHEINEKIQAEREVYFRRAELRAFDSFNGDVDRMVSALKNQILTFIYTSKIFAGDAPSPEERAKRQKLIEEKRENLKKAIEHNEALLKQYPDDEELKKNTEELKNTDPEKVLQFHYDMIYSEKALHERIKESFALYLDFLEKAAPEAYLELQAYIDEAIKHRDEIEPEKPIKDIKPKDFNFIDLGQYMKLPQDNHTNNLAHKLTTKVKVKDPAQFDLTGKATITSQDFRLYIEGYDKLVNGANTSAVKFFDAAVITCSRNRDPLARIPLKKYMELRGLKDEKEARKQIKADMEVLKSVKFEYKGTGKGRGDWLSLSLYGGRAGIYRGVIEFRFTPEFYASIPKNQFMFIPKEYFSTRDRYNPHTAYFIRRIAEHKRMNLGKPNENIIGVETLVNSSPTFPKYEDVNYRFTQFILEPFERDMDAIQSIKWHYAGEQPTNYNEFITSNVVITWVDYPDVAKLTQRKKNSLNGDDTNKKRSKKRG